MSNQKPSRAKAAKKPRHHKARGIFVLLLFLVIGAGVAYYFLTPEPNVHQAVTSVTNKIAPKKAPPKPINTPIHDKELEKIISRWATNHPNNTWSVTVLGLGHDLRYGAYKSNKVYFSASVYKLLLMYPLFQKTTLDEAKTINVNSAGTPKTILECVSLALKISDNPCGHAIGTYVGWAKADDQLKKIGLKYTMVSSPSGSLTSAGDTANYLKRLYNNELFDEPTKDYIISTMQHGTWRGGIPTGCKGCTVANKTGDLGVRHDAAIIKDDNDSYVLVIFTDGASYTQIAQLTTQIQNHMRQQTN